MRENTFKKGTPFYNAFTDYYQLIKKYVNADFTNKELPAMLDYDFSFMRRKCPENCLSFMEDLQHALKTEILNRQKHRALPELVKKGSFYYEVIADYTPIMKKYLDGNINGEFPDCDEFWDGIVNEVDHFYKCHKSEYAKELALSLINELERRYKLQIKSCA